eukprot:scaffold63766_cov21-Tisochrysis_lutea.AAC.1
MRHEVPNEDNACVAFLRVAQVKCHLEEGFCQLFAKALIPSLSTATRPKRTGTEEPQSYIWKAGHRPIYCALRSCAPPHLVLTCTFPALQFRLRAFRHTWLATCIIRAASSVSNNASAARCAASASGVLSCAAAAWTGVPVDCAPGCCLQTQAHRYKDGQCFHHGSLQRVSCMQILEDHGAALPVRCSSAPDLSTSSSSSSRSGWFSKMSVNAMPSSRRIAVPVAVCLGGVGRPRLE